MTLRFKRISGTEQPEYRCYGLAHVYFVSKRDGKWLLSIYRTEIKFEVQLIADKRPVYSDYHDLKGDAVAVASEYEALGEAYRHPSLSRATVAIQKAYAPIIDRMRTIDEMNS